MFSAVRVGGTRLYELARQGVEIERAARSIEIFRLHRERFEGDVLEISVECSKGTYVRTLAMEVGRALGCGAYLTGLRRTAVGAFGLAQAVTLEDLESGGIEAARRRLLPVDVLVGSLPRRDCDAAEAERFEHGQELPGTAPTGTEIAVFGPGSRFLGVGLSGAGSRLAPVRLMAGAQGANNPDFS